MRIWLKSWNRRKFLLAIIISLVTGTRIYHRQGCQPFLSTWHCKSSCRGTWLAPLHSTLDERDRECVYK